MIDLSWLLIQTKNCFYLFLILYIFRSAAKQAADTTVTRRPASETSYPSVNINPSSISDVHNQNETVLKVKGHSRRTASMGARVTFVMPGESNSDNINNEDRLQVTGDENNKTVRPNIEQSVKTEDRNKTNEQEISSWTLPAMSTQPVLSANNRKAWTLPGRQHLPESLNDKVNHRLDDNGNIVSPQNDEFSSLSTDDSQAHDLQTLTSLDTDTPIRPAADEELLQLSLDNYNGNPLKWYGIMPLFYFNGNLLYHIINILVMETRINNKVLNCINALTSLPALY